MSLQRRVGNPPPFFSLPLWRKTFICLAAVIFVIACSMWVIHELDVHGDPIKLEPQTGHIYEARVMHGSVRYATFEERRSLLFWQRGLSEWAGPLFALAFFVWVSYWEPTRAAPTSLTSNQSSKGGNATTA